MTRRRNKLALGDYINQRFSTLDRHEYRVCRHWGRPMIIGYRRRRSSGTLEKERLLWPDKRRWREILDIASGEGLLRSTGKQLKALAALGRTKSGRQIIRQHRHALVHALTSR